MFRRILVLTRFELSKMLGRRVVVVPTLLFTRLPALLRTWLSIPSLLLTLACFLLLPIVLAGAFEIFATALRLSSNNADNDVRNAWVVTANSMKIGTYLLLFFVASSAGTAYSEEIEHGTLKTILTKSFRRFEFVIAKFLSGSVLTILSLLALLVGSVLAGTLFYEFGPVRDADYPDNILVQVPRLIQHGLIGVTLVVPALLAVLSLGHFISITVRQSGYAVGSLTLIGLFCFVVPTLFDYQQFAIFPQVIRPLQQYQDFAANFTGTRFKLAAEIPGLLTAIIAIIAFQFTTISALAMRDISE